MSAAQAAACPVEGRMPEIYLDAALSGNGWIVRKGDVINVGFGRVGAGALASHVSAYVEYLRSIGRLPPGTPTAWPGHAYLVRETTSRAPAGERVLLVGDAAGLARGCSGEGIRAAVESGLAAAETVMAARGSYDCASLSAYRSRLNERLGPVSAGSGVANLLPSALRTRLGRALLGSRRLTRRLLLDRWLAA
jgi:flavin-dependent dehydrogenase